MSLHLMDCVKPLQLQPSKKLALMAFADSAGDRDRIGHPGLDNVMKWACVSRTQASDLIKDLVAEGLLRKHMRGHKGRNARYVVFPTGCCEAHGALSTDQPAGAAEVAAALGVALTPDQVAAIDDLVQGPAHRHHTTSTGSGPPDSSHGTGSGPPDPLPEEGSGPPAPHDETTSPEASPDASGATKGPAHRHRFLGFTTNPPTPTGSAVGGACPAHQPDPGANCRGCGTTPRQLAAAARAAAALNERDHRLADQAARASRPPPQVDQAMVSTLVADTRRKIRGHP